jgi:hypothetical protein
MIAKHTNVTSSTDRELQQYRCISTASDDLLQWWKRQAETFPKLSLLAQGILAVPVTCQAHLQREFFLLPGLFCKPSVLHWRQKT